MAYEINFRGLTYWVNKDFTYLETNRDGTPTQSNSNHIVFQMTPWHEIRFWNLLQNNPNLLAEVPDRETPGQFHYYVLQDDHQEYPKCQHIGLYQEIHTGAEPEAENVTEQIQRIRKLQLLDS